MRFLLGQEHSFNIPSAVIPKSLRHHNSYIVSLSEVCRWLAVIAEDKGVDVFPDSGASSLIYDDQSRVVGVNTPDRGIGKDGYPTEDSQPGYALYGKSVVLAEGVLGTLTQEVIKRYHLEGKGQRTYGLGLKEVWEIPGCDSAVGRVVHTIGYPMQRGFKDRNYGGGFVYIQSPSQVHIGYVSEMMK